MPEKLTLKVENGWPWGWHQDTNDQERFCPGLPIRVNVPSSNGWDYEDPRVNCVLPAGHHGDHVGVVSWGDELTRGTDPEIMAERFDEATWGEDLPEDKLLTPDELADMLSISVHTLAGWRSREKRGPKYIKVGANVRYRYSDVSDWLDEMIQTFDDEEGDE